MTTTKIRTSNEKNTSNGSAVYYDSPLPAAQQAIIDVAAFNTRNQVRSGDNAAVGAVGIGAAAAAAQAVVAAGQLGVMLADTVNGGSTSAGSMEITVTNYTSGAVIPYDYSTTSCMMSNVPNPLGVAESDVYLLTASSAFPSTTSARFDFLVGSGTSPVQFSLYLSYSSTNDVWGVSVLVDGDTQHPFPTARQMFGFTFTGNTGFPKFSAYITPVESANGMMSLLICDKG